jgi:hypothetical protein
MDAGAAVMASKLEHNPDSGAYGYANNLVHWFGLGITNTRGMQGSSFVCDAVTEGGIDVAFDAVAMDNTDIIKDKPA